MNRFTKLLCATVLLSPLCTLAATLEGPIALTYDASMFSKNSVKKEFGDVVKATTDWRVGDFFGKQTVFAGAEIKNTGTKPMFFNYYIVFFDKDKKVVGCSGQGSFGDEGLAPGKSTQLGSCLIHLPKDKYKEIVSFQAVIYETDQPPEKK